MTDSAAPIRAPSVSAGLPRKRVTNPSLTLRALIGADGGVEKPINVLRRPREADATVGVAACLKCHGPEQPRWSLFTRRGLPVYSFASCRAAPIPPWRPNRFITSGSSWRTHRPRASSMWFLVCFLSAISSHRSLRGCEGRLASSLPRPVMRQREDERLRPSRKKDCDGPGLRHRRRQTCGEDRSRESPETLRAGIVRRFLADGRTAYILGDSAAAGQATTAGSSHDESRALPEWRCYKNNG